METLDDKEKGQEFLKVVTSMESDRRKHFGMVLLKLAMCYTKEDMRAVVLIETDDPELPNSFFGVNCTEIDSARIIGLAHSVIVEAITEDAPRKEMFN